MTKTKKIKTSRIVTGILAGAAVGAISIFFAKPKFRSNKKEEISKNLDVRELDNTKEDLFI